MEEAVQLRHEAELFDQRTEAKRTGVGPKPQTDHDDGLLRAAVPIMIAAYGAAIGIAVFTFWQSGEALLSIAICVVYMVMFFGVPILMSRVRNAHDARWSRGQSEPSSDRVAVFGGTLGRTEALLQIVIVPLAVAFAFAAFAVIWLSVRP
jgi:hypothetical protein